MFARAARALPRRALHPDGRHQRRERRRLPAPRLRALRSAGAGWSPPICSAPATSTRSRGSPPKRSQSPRRPRYVTGLTIRPADVVPLRRRRARGGHAAPRSRRGTHPQRALASASGKAAASTTSHAACVAASGCATAIVTALADNEIGRLVEDLILQGGVDTSLVSLDPLRRHRHDRRNGLNFTERGFGVRGALGVSDRGHTAAWQLSPRRHRLGSTSSASTACAGCTPAASSPRFRRRTPHVAEEADRPPPHAHGTIVSYDLNYRPSLWSAIGGIERRTRRSTAALARRST